MLAPAYPDDEEDRLAALHALKIMDTAPQPQFDRMTRLATKLFNVPIALVSLCDAQRVWFKSRQGLDEAEAPRDISFCSYVILQNQAFIVENAATDHRFSDHPLVVGAPHIRFYAGVPLKAPNGARIGTLCIIDRIPRQLTSAEIDLLFDLGSTIEDDFVRQNISEVMNLYRSEQMRMQAVLDTVADGIITIDDKGAIQLANPAAKHLFGYEIDEILGRNVKMLMPQPYATEHDQYLTNFATTRKAKVIGIGREVTGLRKDGTLFPMELAVTEMAVDGKIQFVGVVRDISQRKKMERVKQDFVSTVSHELRTPLTSIRGALGLVLKKSGHLLPEKSLRMLETANRNSERLTRLVNDILDLEKIEGGQLDLELNHLDLRILLQQVVLANESYAIQHNITLRLHESETVAMVLADEHRLLQVMANLVSNAAKFSPEGSEVDIFLADTKPGFSRVCVQDHGRGIPEEFRDRIFGRFNQADASDSKDKGGTGLGLSISKAIVERHGGSIGYDSVLGAGSTFYFELPQQQLAPRLADAGTNGATSQPVLICEDNADVAEILRSLLEEEQIGSEIVATGQAAKAALMAKPYRLLLLDLTLPDMDGLSLLREIRATSGLENLQVIVVSGRALEGKRAWRGDALAVIDWLQKPLDEHRLLRAIKLAFANSVRRTILHVDDDADTLLVTQHLIEDLGSYDSATSLKIAREKLLERQYDLLLLDLNLLDGSGLELIPLLPPQTRVVVYSGTEPAQEVKDLIDAALKKGSSTSEDLLATIKTALNP
jgi:PAS domain S-box-containing protein